MTTPPETTPPEATSEPASDAAAAERAGEEPPPRRRSAFANPFVVALGVTVIAALALAPVLLRHGARDAAPEATGDAVAGAEAGAEIDAAGAADGSVSEPQPGAGAADAAVASGPIVRAERAPTREARAEDGDGDDSAIGAEDGTAETLAIRELSATAVETEALVGGRIVLVSAHEPRVVMLADGRRFSPGASLPGGHVVAAIERERIVLEHDGDVSVIRLP